MKSNLKLLIISHTPHYQADGHIVGWGPTVREIDHLAALFSSVEHLAPLHPGPAPASALPYTLNNIRLNPVKPAGGEKLKDKLAALWQIPNWIASMQRAMRTADALHVRCPAGISIIALLVVRFWGRAKPCWVKYAGSWQDRGKEPWSYWLQRWLLQKNWHRGVVTVNGYWQNQPSHIRAFNNPSMTLAEYEYAVRTAQGKSLTHPIQLLFVGRIEQAKGVGRLLEIAVELEQRALDYLLTLVGDSSHREGFESVVQARGLADRVRFTGWLPFSDLKPYYQKAHLFLLPSSASEGWPKVISEAMAYGVVPIASAISSIPQALAQIGAGKTIPPDQITDYVEAIMHYAQNPAIWELERDKCTQAGVRYTYQAYLDAVISMFREAWQIELTP